MEISTPSPRVRRSAGVLVPLILLAFGAAAVWGASDAPAAAISPDARPALILLLPDQELMLVHHAHPLSDGEAQALAMKLGLLIAVPIIRHSRRESRGPLPLVWRTAEADRGFTASLLAPLTQPGVNWPWRSLTVASSAAMAQRQARGLTGQDVITVALHPELIDLSGRVELTVQTHESVLSSAGTSRERGRHIRLEYFTVPFQADARRPRHYAAAFAPGGQLDQRVAAAAVDLGRFLAFAVTQVAVSPELRQPSRTLGQLHVHLSCSACRPGDPVLYEEPGRIWLQSINQPDTLLSLPLK